MRNSLHRTLSLVAALSVALASYPGTLSSPNRVLADTGRGTGKPEPNTISIIQPDGEVRHWSWNGSRRSCPKASGSALVDGNLFGLRSSGGTAEMWTEGGLHASIRLEQMEKRGFIIGYPEVIYGYKPFGALLSDQSPLLRLPLKLSEIPELWSFSDYAVISGKDPDLALDVAYDFWLTREPKPSTIRKGDIELMVWTYHRNLRPAGALIKDSGVDIPTWINGTLKKAHWVAYLSDVDSPTRTSILISFALDEDGSGGAENGGISQGLVGVNLKEILHQTVILVNRKAGWESSYVSGLFVNDIELGTEFGTNQDHAAFDWELKSYRFVIGSREVGNEGKF